MKVFTTVALTLSALVLTSSAVPTTIGSCDGLVQVSADSRDGKYTAKLKIELCADIQARAKVTTTGLIPAHAGVDIPDIATRVKAEGSIAISGKVDADAKVMVLDRIRGYARKIIAKHCVRQAKPFARKIEGLMRRDIGTLFDSYKRHLVGYVRANIKVVVRNLSVNLHLAADSCSGLRRCLSRAERSLGQAHADFYQGLLHLRPPRRRVRHQFHLLGRLDCIVARYTI
ncbi:MAG: hypothetical protein J3Q66DRAFT_420930 [Benniella sp.]|nr:MAG: hypothetical protein J3Q66DRAFT_420930 [Benniella sp.]